MEVACAMVPEATLLALHEERGVAAEDLWEEALRRLEGVGAAVESERAGEAFFAVDGLRGIHGGDTAGVVATARRAVALPVRIAVAPTRFAAWAAARDLVAPWPVTALASWLGLPERESADLIETMRRLGIGTLDALAALSPDRVADRFGPPGLRALRLARGEEPPLRPRHPHEELIEEVELPEGTAGSRLERALELLVERLLAAPQRRGRTVLGLRLAARLSDGGSWSVDQGLGRPTASARVLRTVLAPRLEALPAPAVSLRLRAVGLGARAADQLELPLRGDESRRHRLAAALHEVRAAQGADSLLKVLPVDSSSRVPERRDMLTPFPLPRR
jgi:protein ImuB